MKIVILDAHAANPGDLSWDILEGLGELCVYERTAPEDINTRCAGAQIVLTNKTQLGAAHFAALPELRYIGVLATGVNVVDTEAAAARDIIVTNVPAYSTDSVAQLVFALIMELTIYPAAHSAWARENWSRHVDFTHMVNPTMEIAGKTMGIIGYGNIGRKVAEIARAFSMDVLVYSRSRADAPGIRWADTIEEVFAQADILSLHCPLNAQTQHMVNQQTLSMMKETALLINTTRGDVVDEQALADALNQGKIAGAGVDVLSTEPPRPDNPLLTAKNCLITPHIAWATREARIRLLRIAQENVRAFVDGKPVNRV